MPNAPTSDHEVPARSSRRRGAKLNQAIYLATLLELAETSFEELTFDKIALRAGAGKTSLYRRWNIPAELVLEALTDPLAGFKPLLEPDTGSVATDLAAVLRNFARVLDEPHGRALRPLMTQRARYPELFDEVHRLVVQPGLEVIMNILRDGAARGEVAPEAVNVRIAGVAPRLMIYEHIKHGTVTDDDVTAILGEVMLPLVAPRYLRKP